MLSRVTQSPSFSLVGILLAWKIFLLVVALLSPGPGYDTSTSLALSDETSSLHNATYSPTSYSPSILVQKLVRWDAIYFVDIATRGYQYEQEWAFGWGFAKPVSLVASREIDQFLYSGGSKLTSPVLSPSMSRETIALTGIAFANSSHLLSVLVLRNLAERLLSSQGKSTEAFVVSCLHIIAPAGLFLAAPYGESLFSLLNFSGMLFYAKGSEQRSAMNDVYIVVAGGFFGLASTVRSNGVLSGLIFALELVLNLTKGIKSLKHCAVLVVGGALIAFGFAFPQVIAYMEVCQSHSSRKPPWCSSSLPSVYTYVQKRYW